MPSTDYQKMISSWRQKLTAFKFISVGIFIFFASPSLAAVPTPHYSSITDYNEAEAVVQFKELERSLFYRCNLVNLNCSLSGSTSPKLSSPSPVQRPPFSRPGATRITRSPSDRYIAWHAPATNSRDNRTFGLYDSKTKMESTIRRSVPYWDLLTEEFRLFAFSPNETRLVYLDDRDGYPSLYLVDLSYSLKPGSLNGERLITRQYTVADFIFIDENRLVFLANREQPHRFDLYEFNLTTRALQPIATNITYGTSLKKMGSYITFGKHDGSGVEIMLYHTENKNTATFTFPDSKKKPLPINQSSPLKLGSVTGLVAKPDNFNPAKSYPLIVWLHGGPYRQAASGYHPYLSYGVFDWLLEGLRRQGYLIAKVDYRGSYGFGRKFAEGIQYQNGKADLADVTAAINTLKQNFSIKETYLLGNSYGGYLSLKGLVEKPDLITGAISINGVTDWHSLLVANPNSIFNVHFRGMPEVANVRLYDQASILGRLNRIGEQKILLIHAQADNWVPVTQADLLYSELLNKGKKVKFEAIPDEEHIFQKRSSLTTICNSIFEYLGITNRADCQY